MLSSAISIATHLKIRFVPHHGRLQTFSHTVTEAPMETAWRNAGDEARAKAPRVNSSILARWLHGGNDFDVSRRSAGDADAQHDVGSSSDQFCDDRDGAWKSHDLLRTTL
jgi:hypothetical protein